jgi:hypothetical protein
MARLTRLGDDDRSFDREFWKKAGPSAIFEAMWDMVNEYFKIRGNRGDQPRLQRTVTCLKRKEG